MANHFYSFFVFALIIYTGQSKVTALTSDLRPRLQFIGESCQTIGTSNANVLTNVGNPRRNYYFLSQNAAGYATAESDCKAQLGADATLLYIETEEELQAVTSFLSSNDNTGSTYWVGGTYKEETGKLMWGNNVEIGAFAPWENGHPNAYLPVTRVSAYIIGSLKLRTEFHTVSNRYICELQVSARPSAAFAFLGQYKSPDYWIKQAGTSDDKSGFSFISPAITGNQIGNSHATSFKRDDVGPSKTSFYFLSQNAAGFTTAVNDCKSFFGDNATLLYVETEKELEKVTNVLVSSDDTGSIYWVGGTYDQETKAFTWLNGVKIETWAPWEASAKNAPRTPQTRVAARTVGSFKLRPQLSTISSRYICEFAADISQETAKPCYNDNDLVIVVDSSGSIGQSNYMVALEFVTRLAVAWADNPRNRLSVIIYSNDVQFIMGLNNNFTVSQIRDKIYNAPYLGAGTATHLGLIGALREFASNDRAVPKNIVFLTDGESSHSDLTISAAKEIQRAGITAFSVGIGNSLNPSELLEIAGKNQGHVFNTNGFDDLLKLLQPISENICK